MSNRRHGDPPDEAYVPTVEPSWQIRLRQWVQTITFLAVAVSGWAVIATFMWGWYLTAPFGVQPVNPPGAVGLAMIGWVFREGAYGPMRTVTVKDAKRQIFSLAGTFAIAWALHFFVAAR